MGIIKKFFGANIADPIEAIGDAIDKVSTTDEERLAGQAVMEQVRQQPFLFQAAINKVAAGHRSWWVAGGRPALLWVAAIGWFMEFVLNPFYQMYAGKSFDMPVEQMVWLTGAVLGIYGSQRTLEKLQGRAK